MRRALFLLLAVSPAAAHAVIDTVSTTDPGSADRQYSWVGQMSGGSAVAVGPHTILTAGHIAGGDFLLDGTAYRMLSTSTAPKVSGSVVDLRVVQVADVLPGWYATGTKVANKSAITMVGFGTTGVVSEDGDGYDTWGSGVRHEGDNLVTSHSRVKGQGPVLISMLDGAGDSVLSGGDSGGGWFSNGKLVGISDFTFTNNSSRAAYGWGGRAYFGSGAIDLTNKSVAKWVSNQISEGDALGTRTVNPVPEPATFLAFGAGAAALLRRRRKV